MNALAKIQAAGFEIWLKDSGNIGIRPFDALTGEQLAYLKTHKAEIVAALAANDAAPDPLIVEVFTPSGTPMTIRADNPAHADWLRQMNPRPANPTPKPGTFSGTFSETKPEEPHNAQGLYFKFLATWPDGSQCYLCQMPRQTLDEMRAQYPTAANIQPVLNEEYHHD